MDTVSSGISTYLKQERFIMLIAPTDLLTARYDKEGKGWGGKRKDVFLFPLFFLFSLCHGITIRSGRLPRTRDLATPKRKGHLSFSPFLSRRKGLGVD